MFDVRLTSDLVLGCYTSSAVRQARVRLPRGFATETQDEASRRLQEYAGDDHNSRA